MHSPCLTGNYRNYYTSRRNSDERLNYLEKEWFANKKCIDVGCNSGIITSKLAKEHSPTSIIGIDNDEKLIETANKLLKGNIIVTSKSLTPTAFVPRSLSNSIVRNRYPHNVKFEVKDILSYTTDKLFQSTGSTSLSYDTVACLSLCKWIHLYNGDFGLIQLFCIMNYLLKLHGILILEYQPWSSYTNNKDKSDICKENYKSIRLYPLCFEYILCKYCGFKVIKRIGSYDTVTMSVDMYNNLSITEQLQYQHQVNLLSKGFNRPILVLEKIASISLSNISNNSISCNNNNNNNNNNGDVSISYEQVYRQLLDYLYNDVELMSLQTIIGGSLASKNIVNTDVDCDNDNGSKDSNGSNDADVDVVVESEKDANISNLLNPTRTKKKKRSAQQME